MSKKPLRSGELGRKWVYLQVAALILLSAAVYINTLWNGFVFDDDIQVLKNVWIKDIDYIPDIFKSNVWGFRGTFSNYYRPVMHLVYMFGYHIFGFEPWGYHLINIVLNTVVCVLVFAVARRLLSDSGVEDAGKSFVPFITAAIFAVHPIHTEAVAWVASVPDLTYAIFYLLALYFYMISRGGGASAGRAYVISVALFFASLFCKEPAATLPAVLLGYDYAVKRRKDGLGAYFKRYLPYVLAIAVYLVIRVSALGGFAPNPPTWKLGPYLAAINFPPVFSQYIGKLLLPIGLNVTHPFHKVSSLLSPAALVGAAVTACFLAALVISLRKRSIWAFGLLFIIVPLLPALYIPAVGKFILGERYLYLPVFGFALLISLAYETAAARVPEIKQSLGIFVGALVIAYSVWTVACNRVWADDMTLFSHSIRMAPENSFAHTSLGEAYYMKGLVDKAMDEYNTALRFDNDNTMAQVDLAAAYIKKGMLDKAVEKSEFAISRAEGNLFVLALAHSNLGAVYTKKGQLDKAVEELKLAVKIDPMVLEAHSNLGAIYVMKGQLDQALEHNRFAVDIAPDFLEFRNNLGIVYSMMGRYGEAIEQFTSALKINPLDPKAHNNMGITYAKMGRPDMAAREFEEALKQDPDDELLRENLRRAYGSSTGRQPRGR